MTVMLRNAFPLLLLVSCCPAAAGDDLTELEERAMQQAVQRVAPSVVRIETFGGQERVGAILVSQAPTSGLALTADGYLVSSAFNFIQRPTSILVTMPSGKRAAAEIVSRDHSAMLVLLKVNSDEPLIPATAASLEGVQVGQWALAVGRTYQADHPSVSVGIVSAKNRIWGKAIQTDAKISPRNYGGPLVDIAGQVLGVLVPLSPQGNNEIAGAEWYDSGIGFAIPLSGIYERLQRMQEGDLHPGVLGISLQGNDPHSGPIEIAACQARSPAYLAGLRVGDKIVEIDGAAVRWPNQLKQALGTKYAGDQVRMLAMRGEQQIDATIELTDELEPYAHPFLGVLPRRQPGEQQQPGTVVRFVFADSGAEAAGLRAGDRITSVNERPQADANALRLTLANFEPGQDVMLSWVRDGKPASATVKLGTLPTEIPATLPPPGEPASSDAESWVAGGSVDIKIPESSNRCFAYVPAHDRERAALGVLVHLIAPAGAIDRKQLIERWQAECDRRQLILLVPLPEVPNRWLPTEIEFVHKALDQVLGEYPIDKTRVVVSGDQAGGALAYLVGFRHRELFRGVAVFDAALPLRIQLPHNDPVQRMAFYLTLADESPLADRIRTGAERLGELRYPVTLKHLGDAPRSLDQQERAELLRWIDTLDRL